MTPQAVEEAFIKANPGLSASAMAVGCDAKRLTEVRLCLSKDPRPRLCGDCQAQLPPGGADHAADARRLKEWRAVRYAELKSKAG